MSEAYLAAVRRDVVVGTAHRYGTSWDVFTTRPTRLIARDVTEQAARDLLALLGDPLLETKDLE